MTLHGTPYSKLSHKAREATPPAFAQYLIERTGARAALWVRKDTIYRALGLDCWDIERNAREFDGPGPIIAHPPCGPWGVFAWNCNQSENDGRYAMLYVHMFGGVVEQPLTSKLFRECGCECGWVERVDQGAYGHPIKKPTALFFHS